MTEKKPKLVSGPIICFRLEGNVEGVQKIVYLFGDVHMSVNFESQCPSWKSDNFVRYFSKTMANTNKNTTYDLFFEIGKNSLTTNIGKRERYIDEVAKYFGATLNIVEDNKLHKLDKSNKPNKPNKVKNIGSKEEPNLRLHHVDIRELFNNENKSSQIIYNIEDWYKGIEQNFDATVYVAEQIKTLILNYKNAIDNETYLLLSDGSDSKEIEKVKNYLGKEIFEKIENTINKIKNMYNSQYVKNTLLMEAQLIAQIKESKIKLFESCEKFMTHVNDLVSFWDSMFNVMHNIDDGCGYYISTSDRISKSLPIIKEFSIFYTLHLDVFVLIMDVYALRRMLDKKYITNVITYTGVLHTCNYLHTLVKYFGFKITHCTNGVHTIQEFNKIVQECKSGQEVFCKCAPKELYQCIDMSDFPENFT